MKMKTRLSNAERIIVLQFTSFLSLQREWCFFFSCVCTCIMVAGQFTLC